MKETGGVPNNEHLGNSTLAETMTLFRRHGLLVFRDPTLYVARAVMFLNACIFFGIIYIKSREREQDQFGAGEKEREASFGEEGKGFTREEDLLVKLMPSEDTKSGVSVGKGKLFRAALESHNRPVVLLLDEWDKTRPTADGFFLHFLNNLSSRSNYCTNKIALNYNLNHFRCMRFY